MTNKSIIASYHTPEGKLAQAEFFPYLRNGNELLTSLAEPGSTWLISQDDYDKTIAAIKKVPQPYGETLRQEALHGMSAVPSSGYLAALEKAEIVRSPVLLAIAADHFTGGKCRKESVYSVFGHPVVASKMDDIKTISVLVAKRQESDRKTTAVDVGAQGFVTA